jgi:hypothetical protein
MQKWCEKGLYSGMRWNKSRRDKVLSEDSGDPERCRNESERIGSPLTLSGVLSSLQQLSHKPIHYSNALWSPAHPLKKPGLLISTSKAWHPRNQKQTQFAPLCFVLKPQTNACKPRFILQGTWARSSSKDDTEEVSSCSTSHHKQHSLQCNWRETPAFPRYQCLYSAGKSCRCWVERLCTLYCAIPEATTPSVVNEMGRRAHWVDTGRLGQSLVFGWVKI